jgi:hypothetical protein
MRDRSTVPRVKGHDQIACRIGLSDYSRRLSFTEWLEAVLPL